MANREHYSRAAAAVTVLILLLAAAGLRFYRLDAQSAWDNESFSIVMSRLSMPEMTARLVQDFVHPPLYQYALHWWFGIFGFGVFQARALSAVFGIAAVWMIYWLGSITFGRQTGLIAALLMTVSQLGVDYSQESRSYAMTMCVTIVTTILFWLALQRRTRMLWLGFVLSATVLIYLHYVAALSVACMFGFALIARIVFPATRPVPVKWLLAGGLLIVVAFIPWFATGFLHVAAVSSKVVPKEQPPWFAVSWSTFIRDVNRFNDGGFSGPMNSAPWWSYPAGFALFSIPALLALRPLLRRDDGQDKTAEWLLAALWLVPHVSLIALGAVGIQYNIRYVLFALPPYYILAARGIALLPVRWRPVHLALAGVYALISVSALYRIPYKENYKDSLSVMAHDYRPGDICVFAPTGFVPLQWSIYYGDRPLNIVDPADIDRSVDDNSRVWVLFWKGTDNMLPMNQAIDRKLVVSHDKAIEKSYYMVDLALYVPKHGNGG